MSIWVMRGPILAGWRLWLRVGFDRRRASLVSPQKELALLGAVLVGANVEEATLVRALFLGGEKNGGLSGVAVT